MDTAIVDKLVASGKLCPICKMLSQAHQDKIKRITGDTPQGRFYCPGHTTSDAPVEQPAAQPVEHPAD